MELPSRFKDMLELDFKNHGRERTNSIAIKHGFDVGTQKLLDNIDHQEISSYRDRLKDLGKRHPSISLRTSIAITVNDQKALEDVKTVIMQELEDRQDLAQDIFDR